MEHNGRQNLPMSTGCITTAITMQYNDKTLNIGSEETSASQLQEPTLLEQQAGTIP